MCFCSRTVVPAMDSPDDVKPTFAELKAAAAVSKGKAKQPFKPPPAPSAKRQNRASKNIAKKKQKISGRDKSGDPTNVSFRSVPSCRVRRCSPWSRGQLRPSPPLHGLVVQTTRPPSAPVQPRKPPPPSSQTNRRFSRGNHLDPRSAPV